MHRRRIRVDAVWDIECEDWDQFVVGGIYWKGGAYSEFWHENEDDFVRSLMECRGTIWAHFAGGYDMKWFLDRAKKRVRDVQIVHAGQARIISLDFGHLLMCDSYALAPMKLKDFTKGLGVEKEELDLPCVCGEDCGGYCSITRHMGPQYRKIVSRYLRADNESLYKALTTLSEYAADHDLDLGRTIGSSAWRNVQRTVGIPSAASGEYALDAGRYKYAARSYYGGRCQLYRRFVFPDGIGGFSEATLDGHEQDVNSMYPWSLKTFALPYGDHRMSFGRSARSLYSHETPGIYRATVEVPECFIPPLPVRYNNGMSIAYPTGKFSGIWTLPELIHAESTGAKVHVSDALTWETSIILFTEWIDKLWDLRIKAPFGGKKGPIGTWLKLYMNSLTGKFGSKPEKTQLIYNPSEIRDCDCKCRSCGILARKCKCPIEKFNPPEICKCDPMYQVSDSVWSTQLWRIEDCAHVQFSAYLTANARVALHKAQISDGRGGETVFYSDTDSIYSTEKLKQNIGKDLGQFDYGGEVKSFIGIAPKVYSFERPGTILPFMAKAKGITIKREKDGSAHFRPKVQKRYTKEGVIGFRAGLAQNRFFKKRENFHRTLAARPGDRVWLYDSKGKPLSMTRPPDAKELNRDEGFGPDYD